ncbi:MAG: CbtB-domain containing protein [Nitrospinae bacterium]|nr:CbtB-domain containing protein [Nitrospinota bacterium]MCY4384125.1 CbtB-domain containing protein [Nitrospinota bacterium]
MAFYENAVNQEVVSDGLIRRMAAVKPAILAIVLGIFILYGVGFAQPQLLHDAAHDTRHAFAFPCH